MGQPLVRRDGWSLPRICRPACVHDPRALAPLLQVTSLPPPCRHIQRRRPSLANISPATSALAPFLQRCPRAHYVAIFLCRTLVSAHILSYYHCHRSSSPPHTQALCSIFPLAAASCFPLRAGLGLHSPRDYNVLPSHTDSLHP